MVLERDGKVQEATVEFLPSDLLKSMPSPGNKALLQRPREVTIHTLLDYHSRQRPHSLEAAQGLPATSPSGLKAAATHSVHGLGTFGEPRPSAELEDTESDQTQALETIHNHMRQMQNRDWDTGSGRTDRGTAFRTGPRKACP